MCAVNLTHERRSAELRPLLKLADFPRSLALTLVVLPPMSFIRFAPFTISIVSVSVFCRRNVKCLDASPVVRCSIDDRRSCPAL